MKKLFTISLLFAIVKFGYGQEHPEKNKKFDVQIFKYLNALTDQTPFDTFLLYSKPFSKWAIQPLKRNDVWAMDTILTASDICNLFWGTFAHKYKLSISDAKNFPNQLLQQGIDKKVSSASSLKANLERFGMLSNKILASQNLIFVNQGNLQRIDEVYREGNKYWKYIVPKESPFPMSDKIDSNAIANFSDKQYEILNLLSELNLYAAVKTKNGIFYLIDGFTDNSYGYFFSKTGKMETDNFLFDIMSEEQINENYFYYVAN